MSQTDTRAVEVTTTFSQPIRAITTMLLVCILVGAGAWLIHNTALNILRTNPALNGVIGLVFLVGVLSCFWQVWILAQSVYWIENFVRGTAEAKPAPRRAFLRRLPRCCARGLPGCRSRPPPRARFRIRSSSVSTKPATSPAI
jgi:hypothetical protein